MLPALVCWFLFAQSPSSAHVAPRILAAATGREVTIGELVDELARRDVVFLGEEHDNEPGHQFYLQLIGELVKARSDLVLSMEMFERDVQGLLDDYLRGRITEAVFLGRSRPWPNYRRDYRAAVELAREKNLDAIAGNLPRSAARKIAQQQTLNVPYAPRVTTAPTDRYWELFQEAMKKHPGADASNAFQMYKSQCAKDDAMAEGIADYLSQHPTRRPLVVHRCGNFHSDYGLGTVSRLTERAPLAQVTVVSMVSTPDVRKPDLEAHQRKAHFLLIVPEAPGKPTEPKSVAVQAGGEKKGTPQSKAPSRETSAAVKKRVD